MAYFEDSLQRYHDTKLTKLQSRRQVIEEEGTARQHGDTLEKRGISVDDLLNPSRENHSKKIKYFNRINKSIKEKLLEFGPKDAKLITFSDVVDERTGGEWDTLLAEWIKKNPGDTLYSTTNPREFNGDPAARKLIYSIQRQHHLYFYDSKFPLFGFMREREVATNEKKHPKLYLWQGEADAISYSRKLNMYVIVEFKVVDNLSDYWKRKTDLCGKHLHQYLVYAKLLQLHMELPYLPPSLIVIIHKVTGKEGYFALFERYPQECYEKIDEYEWFTKQPSKRPLKIVNTDKLLHGNYYGRERIFRANVKLREIFAPNATVKELLDALGYDSLEIFQQEQQ